jgi:hypothetical protein
MEKQEIAATPRNLRNAHRMIWGGFMAGMLFIMAGEVVTSLKTNSFISFSPYFITPLVLSVLSIFIIARGYYLTLLANNRNLWWLLLLIPLTPFVMFFASIILYGFVWLSLTVIGSVFDFYF